jgi:3-oxoadipate enol-lactonase
VPSLVPPLPEGRLIAVPGRGPMWAWEAAGPPGAPTVVLLHGWTSTAALNWFRCFRPLAARFRVVAPDLRGHGRGIRSRWPFRLEDCADDVAALVASLGTGPVVAAGYSMGGPVAQLLWHRHPEAVRGLVLCATSYGFSRRSALAGPIGLATFGASLALSGIPAGLRQEGFSRIVRRRATSGFADWAVAEWERNDPAALIQAGLAIGRYDARPWIGTVDVPTVVVVTAADRTVVPARQWALVDRIPGAEAISVPGDHRACVETPEFVPALIDACVKASRVQAATGA